MTHPDPHAPAVEGFLGQSLDDILSRHEAQSADENVLELYRRTVAEVPAYRDFLARRGLPRDIQGLEDFRQLPLMTKPDYMQAYPLPQRCRGGGLAGCDRVAVSSGSTGTPAFWPRSLAHEMAVAVRFEQVFRDAFQAHERSTLAVVCFALGNWVGGLFTTSCCWHLARKAYPLMVATPGNKKDEIFRVVRELSPHYEQTVLLGYPPFVKDAIDAGLAEGIDWASHRVKTVFAGEVFSEEWRTEVLRRVGSSAPCYDSASLYGTADGGVLGNETPISIAARRFFAANPGAARQVFGDPRLPTLAQYDPHDRYFEMHGNTLVVSGDNGVPLVRYHIADRGGLMDFESMGNVLRDFGVTSLRDFGLDETRPIRRLPFVWVFGRADFTVSYYGANIYPENIAVGLEQPGIMNWVTGKFVMETRDSAEGDHYLSIAVELLPGVSPAPDKAFTIAESIHRQLRRLNSEFAHYTPEDKQLPWVSLLPFEDPEYFPAGVKHRYSRR